MSKERALCYICGEPVMIPPGVIYRGMKVHQHCARLRRKTDFSGEVTSPERAKQEENIVSYFANMGSMVP